MYGFSYEDALSLPVREEAYVNCTKSRRPEKLSRRCMVTAWNTQLPGTWVPRVHAVTPENEIAALLLRSMGPTPEPADPGCPALRRSFGKIRRLARRYGGSRWDLRATAESYTGALRRRYLEAVRSLEEDGPLCSSDSFLRAFLKAEKCRPGKLAKPRMVFPRSPRYNLVLASWLKPFEHWLWGNLRGMGSRGVAKTRSCGKGLNPTERGNLIARKFSAVPDCVVFEVDGKAFEAHEDVWQIVQEHSVYHAAYPGDGDLMRVLSKQLFNRGVTSCGVRFGRPGGRASGDFNTGMGNSIVMLAVIDATMREIGTSLYDSLVDGDNALLFVSRSSYQAVVKQFAPTALRLSGHEMTVERPVDVLEGVCFGQSHPLRVGGNWVMVRDWRKVVSQGTSSHAHLNEPKFARDYLYGVSLCESWLGSRVPILWKWSETLRHFTEKGAKVRFDAHRDYSVLGVPLGEVENARALPPDEESRLSFFRAFGVTPDEQIYLEKNLRFPDISYVREFRDCFDWRAEDFCGDDDIAHGWGSYGPEGI